MPKLIWRVDPAPTGRYRSFQKRSWPHASYASKNTFDSSPAAMIQCVDSYHPADVREGKHAELVVFIADHSKTEIVGEEPKAIMGFKWRRCKERAKTLDEAKAIAQRIIDNNPNIQPKEANG